MRFKYLTTSISLKSLISLITLISLVYSSCQKPDSGDDTLGVKLPEATIQKLDDIITSQMQDNNLPGVIVGIWIPGEGEYLRSFGTANLQAEAPRKLGHQFRIASISKTFTGLRILQLHDQGLLNINDKLSEYFPAFPTAENITVKHLLNMNSGIKDFADEEFLRTWYENPMMPFSMEQAVQLSAADSAEFYPAGDSVKYCNVNYSLLGLIIEQVTGNTIAEEIHEHIFVPLGMSNSIYPGDHQHPGDLKGYSWDKASSQFVDKTELNPEVPNAAGAIISHLTDLKRYAKALYTGELISDETHQMQINTLPMDGAPEWMQYGLGIINLGGFYGHNGTIFGFSTEMFYMPAREVIIIINVNRLDVDDVSQSGPLFFEITKELFPGDVAW